MYAKDGRVFTKNLVQKAESLGRKTLCVTVDTPVGGAPNSEDRVKFKLPDGINAPYTNGSCDQKLPLSWNEMEWLISFAKQPYY